jgi:chromosome partitioning protein
MKVLAIFNNKGGVGKTTSAQNIGAALAVFAQQRVLLIDADQQASLSLAFGIRLKERQPHLANFILQEASLEQTRVKYKDSLIDIIPSCLDLRKYDKKIEANKNFPFNLKQMLVQVRHHYDYVVIDCPPSISTFTQIALIACDKYYIPLQAEYFSYEGLRNFATYIDELKIIGPHIELGGIFANRFNPKAKKNFSKEIIRNVKEQLGNKILNSNIRENNALMSAQAQGVHIFDYDRKSNGAQDYYSLTKEIWETLNGPI